MIEPSQIYNMDQMMCRFDMPQNRTNTRRGGSTIRIKTTRAEKKGFTVALAASASGEKLPAVIIFKERGGRLGAHVLKKLVIPSNVQVRASANGWKTKAKYHHWLRYVYKSGFSKRILVVDNYKPHRAEESIEIVEKTCKSDVVVVPGGCTSIIQPMDKCINKPFKTFMRQQWQEWMIQDRPTTKVGNLKQPTRQDIINWVSHAWSSIELKVIVDPSLFVGSQTL